MVVDKNGKELKINDTIIVNNYDTKGIITKFAKWLNDDVVIFKYIVGDYGGSYRKAKYVIKYEME